jgi:hypothetical protein
MLGSDVPTWAFSVSLGWCVPTSVSPEDPDYTEWRIL